ncbi:MAG: patatin-like phospholipase family protein [Deltaproteobacteria bacterium]|nr:patatin-like phospholipase family protein [Deltaproteobacteria bacterium]
MVTPSSARTGVVLSGGGARGAYEAGVIAGIVDILAGQGRKRAPFSIFTGTSVGAINATWLAAHAERLGRSFIDPRALEELVQVHIPFRRLRDNVDKGEDIGDITTRHAKRLGASTRARTSVTSRRGTRSAWARSRCPPCC